jgi:hypothetical protein
MSMSSNFITVSATNNQRFSLGKLQNQQQQQVFNNTDQTEVSSTPLKEPVYALAKSISNIGDSLSKDSILSFLQINIIPWLSAISQAFGKSNLWTDIASCLGILWKSSSEFQSKGSLSAAFEFIKLATFAGLGSKYGIPLIKTNIAKIKHSFFRKNWVQALGGLIGMVILQKLAELFDRHLKKALLRFVGNS